MKLARTAVLSLLTPACVTPLAVERREAAGERPGETVTPLVLERGSVRLEERRTAQAVQLLSPPLSPPPYSPWGGP